jgi:hypothetical protein
MLKQPNVLLVEVPPQFIALCETTCGCKSKGVE